MRKRKRNSILYRKSHKGKDVKIFFKPYDFDEEITNSTSKKYVVWSSGKIHLKTDSLKTAEETFSSESGVDGRMKIGKTNVKELV